MTKATRYTAFAVAYLATAALWAVVYMTEGGVGFLAAAIIWAIGAALFAIEAAATSRRVG